MLEKPSIPDESIIACLQVKFALQITHLAFLPLGGDLSTAVYRAVADDGTPYFCKLKRGTFDEISVELPRFLSEQGIPQIIPPLVTNTGRLWADLDEFRIILYPFVKGTSGFEVELSERQWADFGAALKRIHTLALPAHLSQKIRRESFSPEWREACRDILERLDGRTLDDPVTAQWAAFLHPKRETILDHIRRAHRLARTLASRPTGEVLCHSDIHPGNLFIARDEILFIVDWDYPMLAPKERDLMFIGSGQGYVNRTSEEEERFFYRSYGEVAIDPLALAYYRYERNITDITVECTRILSDALGAQDRAQSLQILTWLFMPGGSVELAYASDRTR